MTPRSWRWAVGKATLTHDITMVGEASMTPPSCWDAIISRLLGSTDGSRGSVGGGLVLVVVEDERAQSFACCHVAIHHLIPTLS